MNEQDDSMTLTGWGIPQKALVWQVGALCFAIADSLQARFSPVTVEGEISGFTRASSGHCYFSLKDEQGQLRCALFKRAAGMLNFSPRDGDAVQLRARVDLYSPRGELQLIVESMQQAGQGALYEQFLRLKADLQAEGLFDTARKRSLPVFPRGIGLVTSLGAAALHDVVTALSRRAPHVPVVLAPAQVQGAGAAADIVAALKRLQAYAKEATALDDSERVRVDVILLVRGGGSMEDLWAFNDRALAHAIANCTLPVVTGIGHETDFTMADFVADTRAPTPTAAAELASQSQSLWLAVLEGEATKLKRALERQIDHQEQHLDVLSSRLARPSDRVNQERVKLGRLDQSLVYNLKSRLQIVSHELDQLTPRLAVSAGQTLLQQSRRLDHVGNALKLLDPNHVLARGFAWLEDEVGAPVTRVSDVKIGQTLTAHLQDGLVETVVKQGYVAPNG
jgi:exodeoxyribonuclease VII large subunit